MEPQQLKDGWERFVADRNDYNTECGRVFELPAETAKYQACLSRQRATIEREVQLRQRHRDLGIPEPPPDRAPGSTAPPPGTPGTQTPPPGAEKPPPAAGADRS
jgi:hypothetical protein